MELHFRLGSTFLFFILLFTVLPLFTFCQQTPDYQKTYLSSSDSYALYPPWLVETQGLLEFSFKTSESDALLVYMDSGTAMGDYFRVRLVNGVMSIDLFVRRLLVTSEPTVQDVGQCLNDNRRHNVSIVHNRQNREFRISLDDISPITMTYTGSSSVSPHISSSGLYFGGVPQSLVPADSNDVTDDTHFIGCLIDIRYSNTSTEEDELVNHTPTVESSLRENCVEPCSGVDCGPGVCVPRWPEGICDCRETNMLGASCSEDPALHMLTFTTNSSYFCYDARLQPNTGAQPTTASIRLTPPLPQSGTIMTGHSSNGVRFTLSLKESRIVYELIEGGNIAVVLTSNSVLSQSTSYQLDHTLNATVISLSISTESLSPLENLQSTIPSQIMTGVEFEGICLGGALLEDINYIGTIENAYFNYLSLTEERYFESFGAVRAARGDLIHFEMPGTLEFTKSHLNTSRVSFEIRTDRNGEGVILQMLGSGGDPLQITILNEVISMFSSTFSIFSTCSFHISNGLWHHMELNFASLGIDVTIDRSFDCDFVSVAPNKMQDYLTNPFQFGPPTQPLVGDPTEFTGCFQNFVFEYNNGKTFQPNLEAVIRTEEQFSMLGCLGCISEQDMCLNGGLCESKDHQSNVECECRDGYTGSFCEDSSTPSPTAPSPPPTAPSPTPTTPSPPPTTQSMHIATLSPTGTPTIPPPVALEIGGWIGIGVAAVLALSLLVTLAIVVVILCWSKNGKQGFYKTYETNEKHASVLHYSASLRELSSEIVNVESNGQVTAAGAVQSNGGYDKEFYL